MRNPSSRDTASDVVFQLGWLKPETAHKGIEVLRKWVRDNPGLTSEADTKPVVEAILRGLGWDTLTGDVAREGGCGLGDFHLYYKGEEEERKIAVLVEAERLHCGRDELKGEPLRQLNDFVRNLTDPRSKGFLSSTPNCKDFISKHRLSRDGKAFVYSVLTNGQLWWIYDGLKRPDDTSALSYPPAGEFDLERPDEFGGIRSVLGKDRVGAAVAEFLTG